MTRPDTSPRQPRRAVRHRRDSSTSEGTDSPLHDLVTTPRQPFYPRLLRLHYLHPNGWQRAALGEGMAGLGILLSLADLASAWTIVVLPVAVAVVVKANDVVIGLLEP